MFRVSGSLPSGAVSQMALAGMPAGPRSHPSALIARRLAGSPARWPDDLEAGDFRPCR